MSRKRCSICKEVVSSKAIACPHCGHPKSDEVFNVLPENTGIYEYHKNDTALVSILVIFIGLSYLTYFFLKDILNITLLLDQIIFIGYIVLFTSFWIVYFKSKKNNNKKVDEGFFNVRSLRRLLGETSLHWDSCSNESKEAFQNESENSHRRKATTSMQVLSILIAVSILVLDQVSSLVDEMEMHTLFECAQLILAGIAAFISFVCFVISVDALDVMFNKFKTSLDRHAIINHFYTSVINPKYIGLVAMLASVIFLLAFHNALIGSAAIGITLYFGYYHWFPHIKLDGSKLNEPSIKYVKFILMSLAIVPLFKLVISL